MEDINESANIGEVAEPQQETTEINTNETLVEGGSEPINSQSNEKPTQDKETNSAFAEMRRAREAAEAKAAQVEKDFNYFQKYSNLGVRNEAELRQIYGHQGINSWEDVDAYYEAQEKNIDPQFYKEFNEMKSKLNAYETEKQMKQHDEALSNDPKLGDLYKQIKDDAHAMAQKFNVDLRTGFTLALESKAPELFQKPDVEAIKQQAVKEYIEKIKSGNAPIESSGNTATIINSTPKTFEDARKGALAFLRANKQT